MLVIRLKDRATLCFLHSKHDARMIVPRRRLHAVQDTLNCSVLAGETDA